MYLTDDCQDVGEMDTDVQPGSRQESGKLLWNNCKTRLLDRQESTGRAGALNCSRLGSPAALRLRRGCLDAPHQSSHERRP